MTFGKLARPFHPAHTWPQPASIPFRWECLDIAAASTLGGLANTTEYVANPGAPNGTWIFPVLDGSQNKSTQLYGAVERCGEKIVGDGVVSTLDIATLMYSQFGEAPYCDESGRGDSPESCVWIATSGTTNVIHTGGPDTTQGREVTARQCGNSIQPNHYQLQLASDFCLVGHPPPSPPTRRQLSDWKDSLSDGSGPPDEFLTDRKLSEVLNPQIIGTERELIDRARASMVMRSYDASTMRWSKVGGVGEWTKVTLPGAVVATELFFINAHSAGGIRAVENWPPPPGGCTDLACAPAPGERDNYQFRFQRRPEEIAPGRDFVTRPCALLLTTAAQAFKGRGTATLSCTAPATALLLPRLPRPSRSA